MCALYHCLRTTQSIKYRRTRKSFENTGRFVLQVAVQSNESRAQTNSLYFTPT